MAPSRFRVFDGPTIAKPPEAMARTLKYKPAQEHLLRRLGQAIVLHWQELPKVLQDVLIEQAAMVDDRVDADHSASALSVFVRERARGSVTTG